MALAKAAPTKTTAARVSFNPNTATSGFLDDVDVEITDAQTTMFDYQGQQEAQPALALELTDVNGGQHNQYWTCGKNEDWEPTEDNTGFVSKTGKTGFNSSSNIMHLFGSLLEHGGDAIVSILDSGDCSLLKGLKGHVMIKKLPKRSGIVRTDKAGQEKDPTVLVFSKITSLPGTDTKSAPKAAAKAAATPATKAAAGGKPNGAAAATPASGAMDEIDQALVASLMEALAETDPLPKKTLLQLASAAFKGTPSHSKAIARSNAPDFLKSLPESGISFDGAQFSLA